MFRSINCYNLGLALAEKISSHTSKISEFGNLTDKTDDDHTAIGLLHNFTKHLNDSFKLLTATRRSVESKKNFPGYFIIVIKNPYRL